MASKRHPISPLAFTRAYNTYRAETANTPFADSRLLAATRFWTPYCDSLSDPVLSSFIEEDWPPPLAVQDLPDVEDLHPTEVEEIARFLDMVASHRSEPSGASIETGTAPRSASFWKAASRKHLYVGDADSALTALVHAGLLDTIKTPLPITLELPETANATDLPSMLAEWVEANHPMAARWLRELDTDWSARRESGEINRAHCLVVEYDPNGHPVRGRLRVLEGAVEQLKRADAADEVTVHHQVRAPDDPHFGAIYNALSALRFIISENRRVGSAHQVSQGGPVANSPGPHFHARLTLGPGGTESHTGDSIGLAAFALAFANWWATDIHRERRPIGSSVAFTGGISADGSLNPVSTATLRAKIQRAFHSPITHLALPESSRGEAETELARLRARHPRRRLHLIGLPRPADLIADHNILRTEKVCLGEFAARKAARWGRSVRVQVVVLVGLVYLLSCILNPRLWPLFDTEPSMVHKTPNGFTVYNSAGHRLWHAELPEVCDTSGSEWALGDLTGDGRRDVVFQPQFGGPTELRGMYIAYEADGGELFRRQGIILGQYPGDTSLNYPTSAGTVHVFRTATDTVIVSSVQREYPARAHITIWSNRGDLLGWYVNQGFAGQRVALIEEPGGVPLLVCLGVNNRAASVALFTLPLRSVSGVSPPYRDPNLILSGVRKGNQRHYILLPPTELSERAGQSYNSPESLFAESPGPIRVDVREAPYTTHPGAVVSYTFDNELRLCSASPTDGFLQAWAVETGSSRPMPDQFEAELAIRVLEWSGTSWRSVRTERR